MISYEVKQGGHYAIWVRNEYGKEPLGSLRRDSSGHWYYEPMSGSYMYLGALIDIVNKLYELSTGEEETPAPQVATSNSPLAEEQAERFSSRNFMLLDGESAPESD